MKNMIFILCFLAVACVSTAWGACTSSGGYTSYNCRNGKDNVTWTTDWCSGTISGTCVWGTNPTVMGSYTLTGTGSKYCVALSTYNNLCCTGTSSVTFCDTQAEADSVQISQKCTTGTMAKDTANGNVFDVCKNGEWLLITFNNPITGVRNSSIGYYIVTDNSADSLDEATYNHLAAQACTEVALYRGVLNGKYVYWYSTDPEPVGVVNVVRIK